MSQHLDQYYIDKVLCGETKAFSVLVDRYKFMVFTLAVKILKNKEEAEDVSQDVFVKVFRALNTFNGTSKFSTWLYKIAYYQSLDYLKKQKREVPTNTIDTAATFHLASMENALTRLETNERKQTIKNAIDALSKEDAVLITLHYYEELSLNEIADIMNLKVNTIKVRLFRSRKKLAVALKYKLEPEILENYGRK